MPSGKMSVGVERSYVLNYFSSVFVSVPDGVQDFLMIMWFLKLIVMVSNEIVRTYVEVGSSSEPGEEGPCLPKLEASLLYL